MDVQERDQVKKKYKIDQVIQKIKTTNHSLTQNNCTKKSDTLPPTLANDGTKKTIRKLSP